jgi:hypothetical protein
MVKLWTTAEIEPPDLIVLFHVIVDAAEYPDATVPDPAGVVVARDEFPCPRPGPCLQVKVADVV